MRGQLLGADRLLDRGGLRRVVVRSRVTAGRLELLARDLVVLALPGDPAEEEVDGRVLAGVVTQGALEELPRLVELAAREVPRGEREARRDRGGVLGARLLEEGDRLLLVALAEEDVAEGAVELGGRDRESARSVDDRARPRPPLETDRRVGDRDEGVPVAEEGRDRRHVLRGREEVGDARGRAEGLGSAGPRAEEVVEVDSRDRERLLEPGREDAARVDRGDPSEEDRRPGPGNAEDEALRERVGEVPRLLLEGGSVAEDPRERAALGEAAAGALEDVRVGEGALEVHDRVEVDLAPEEGPCVEGDERRVILAPRVVEEVARVVGDRADRGVRLDEPEVGEPARAPERCRRDPVAEAEAGDASPRAPEELGEDRGEDGRLHVGARVALRDGDRSEEDPVADESAHVHGPRVDDGHDPLLREGEAQELAARRVDELELSLRGPGLVCRGQGDRARAHSLEEGALEARSEEGGEGEREGVRAEREAREERGEPGESGERERAGGEEDRAERH